MATGNIVLTDFQVSSALAAYLSSTAWPSPQGAHLFQNALSPTPSNVLADFTEATYSGYLAQAIVYGTQVQVMPGQYAITSSPVLFPGAVGGSPQTLYGIYVTDSTGTTLIYSWAFASPVVMNAGDPDLIVQVVFDGWAAILI